MHTTHRQRSGKARSQRAPLFTKKQKRPSACFKPPAIPPQTEKPGNNPPLRTSSSLLIEPLCYALQSIRAVLRGEQISSPHALLPAAYLLHAAAALPTAYLEAFDRALRAVAGRNPAQNVHGLEAERAAVKEVIRQVTTTRVAVWSRWCEEEGRYALMEEVRTALEVVTEPPRGAAEKVGRVLGLPEEMMERQWNEVARLTRTSIEAREELRRDLETVAKSVC
ncbi:hypothetical protein MPH_03117 [Macrophomina phaseolina MS6]|uniref:Uncharacterized protein n=1 Tax=Macrophomina phaseolina (strain MS6) TaxID=1126212 RepID=K2SA02_MACPH|nr:hypothetical protein MPH_03117 [Macrophomina phaseolina MS6]